jgi:hypothetical protein
MDFITDNEKCRQELFRMIDSGKTYAVTIKEISGDKLRTAQQNRALHKDFRNTADICNRNNVTADMLFKAVRSEFPVNDVIVKQFWHKVLADMGLNPKTSDLNTKQVSEIREGIAAALAMRLGIDIGDFPSIEYFMNR